jgi:hypothetical protein
LSEQLYQNSTRFLFELIQNADDNRYEVDCPTVAISLDSYSETLRFDCNEVGFSRANLEAICGIGESTKVSKEGPSGYIGEKGIGFKSVFKVADVVWIASGHYSIKFDKRRQLGMIAPIWCDFPKGLSRHQTSILLQLSPQVDLPAISQEIKQVEARILLFLRKLRRIEITVYGLEGGWQTALTRQDEKDKLGHPYTQLIQDFKWEKLNISKFVVQDLPTDAKRPGCKQTQILLAFPTTSSGEPVLQYQKFYAFMPVRDSGFKVLRLYRMLCIFSLLILH